MRALVLAAAILLAPMTSALAQAAPTFTVNVWNGGMHLPEHGWSTPDHPMVYWFDLAEPTPLPYDTEYLAVVELGLGDGRQQFVGAVKVVEESLPSPEGTPKFMAMTHGEYQPAIRPKRPIHLVLWLDNTIDVARIKAVTITASEACLPPDGFYYSILPRPPCW